jgi:integrase
MASIRKRRWTSGDSTREAWVTDYVDGTGKRRLRTFKTKRAADTWLVQARGELHRGVHVADNASVTVAAAATLWLERCERDGLERSTVRQYQTHVAHILPLIGREKLTKLTVPLIESVKDTLLRRLSRVLARKVLGSLKSILTNAQRRGLIGQNVATVVKVETGSRHKDRPEVGREIPAKAEIKTLLDASTGRLRALVAVAAFTGLRASEIRGLTWDHVDFEARLIRVRQRADRWGEIGNPKSAGSRRDLPMAPMVVNTLREWRLACPPGGAGLVFPASNGKVTSHANLLRGLAALQIRTGIVADLEAGAGGEPSSSRPVPKYALHAFRHFFASWLIDQHFGPKRIQALMGHANISMTFDVYGHLMPAEDDHDKFAAGELTVTG